jgi:hypothetical protein
MPAFPPLMLGYTPDGLEAYLDWKSRVVRVTGTIDSGKTTILANIVSKFDTTRADVLVFCHHERDSDWFPGCFTGEQVTEFHEELDRQVSRRLAGETNRPLVVVANKLAAAGDAIPDILRLSRHAEALNAYVLTEDRNRRKSFYSGEFEDVSVSTVITSWPQAAIRHAGSSYALLFHPTVFE